MVAHHIPHVDVLGPPFQIIIFRVIEKIAAQNTQVPTEVPIFLRVFTTEVYKFLVHDFYIHWVVHVFIRVLLFRLAAVARQVPLHFATGHIPSLTLTITAGNTGRQVTGVQSLLAFGAIRYTTFHPNASGIPPVRRFFTVTSSLSIQIDTTIALVGLAIT